MAETGLNVDGQNTLGSALPHVRPGSWGSFLAAFAPRFSAIFLGLATVRVWIQCCMYDRYLATDSGILTVAGTFLRVAIILILMLVFSAKGFSQKTERRLDVISCILMTAAAAFYYFQSALPEMPLSLVASLMGSAGISWGAVVWIRVYARMEPGEVFLYSFLALALSAVVGFVLGVLGATVAYALCLVLPAASLLSSRYAWEHVDGRPPELQAPWVPPVNDKLRKGAIVSLLVGLGVFNLALGAARGFPSGISLTLPLEYQALHQGATVLLCLLLVWWVLIRGHRLTLFLMWGTLCAFIVVGTALIVADQSDFATLGATLITIGNSFSVAVLWFCCYEFSRCCSAKHYLVFGIAWTVHLLPRELGRLAIFHSGPFIDTPMELLVAGTSILLLTVLGMVLLLARRDKKVAFSGFGYLGAQGDAKGFVYSAAVAETSVSANAMADAVVAEAEATYVDAAAADAEATDADVADVTGHDPVDALAARYGLSEREVQIVRYLAVGRSRAYISEELHLSENTVKSYARNLYTKTGVHSKRCSSYCLRYLWNAMRVGTS